MTVSFVFAGLAPLENKFEPIRDGLLVTGGEEIKRLGAVWTVLVTLDAPHPEAGIEDRLAVLERLITQVHFLRGTPNATAELWDVRLEDLRRTVVPPSSPAWPAGRVKRGLLDAAGILAQKLFGIATEADIRKCREQILKASNVNRRVIHTVNELVTVVNQSQDLIQENRAHLLRIESYVMELSRELQYIESIVSGQDQVITLLDSEARLEQALSAIEASHNLWLQQQARYQRQRASLELGWLTEEILPVSELQRILEAGRHAGFETLNLQWYYQHVQVWPMWEEPQRLVFRTHLPLSHRETYLHYRIWTWPVPINSTGVAVTVQVPHAIAINTINANMFQPIPQHCVGAAPRVCRPGPVYHGPGLLCLRGIITGDEAMRSTCPITLHPDSSVSEDRGLTELVPGTFAVDSPGEEYSELCRGQTERRRSLAKGLYLVTLKDGCSLKGDTWLLDSLVHMNTSLSFHLNTIPIVPLNFPNRVQKIIKWHKLNAPIWPTYSKISTISLKELDEGQFEQIDNDIGLQWGSHSGHVSWSMSFIVLAIIIVLICVIIFLCRKSILPMPKCLVFRRRAEIPDKSENPLVVMPLTEGRPGCSDAPCSLPVNTTTKTQCYSREEINRLYPDLAEQLKASLSQPVV